MNLNDLVNNYLSLGYEIADAQSKVCQDLILYKIGKSKYAHNITVKGGVVMHNISKSTRRATRDLDLDFIKYSLDDNSIINFIDELNKNDKGSIIITTNLTFDRWEEIFKDAMLTGAMVDRLAYKAHILDLSRDISHRYEETVSWKNSKNM